jgi:hypothetical protein
MDDDERLSHTKWSANSRNCRLQWRGVRHSTEWMGRLTGAIWVSRFERLQN